MNDRLYMFTIYDDPTDHPGKFVVRRWWLDFPGGEPFKDTEPTAVVPTLEEARAAVPEGMYRLSRLPNDEPQIVETWI